MKRIFAGLVFCVLGAGSGWAQGKTHLETVLAQMDAASEKFRSAGADFQKDLYERVVKSTSTQTGSIYFERVKSGTEMRGKIVQPNLLFLSYSKGLLQVFNAKENSLIKISAKDNKSQYESFLTLGFGGSGSELKKQWTIADQGMEMLDGVSCAKLDLVSKDVNVAAMFTHVTIWVDVTRDISLKQAFYTPSEDVQTAYYRNIKYNARVGTEQYAFRTDGETKVTKR